MASGVTFAPIANGLDFLESALNHLMGNESGDGTKYGVLHLEAASEILLKVRLIEHDWKLVFKDPEKANESRFRNGDFRSIEMHEAINLLNKHCQIEVAPSVVRSFDRLRKERNKIAHLGYDGAVNVAALHSIIGPALDSLLQFLSVHLEPVVSDKDRQHFVAVRELTQEALRSLSSLMEARLARIGPVLDQLHAAVVIDCPYCLQLALAVDDGALSCYYCLASESRPHVVAEDYASEILDISWRDITRGAESPVGMCPECGDEAFFCYSRSRDSRDTSSYVCLSCSFFASEEEIDTCMACGHPMIRDEMVICIDCFNYRVDKND